MDMSSVLKTIAPWLGSALGGPFGGAAVEFIAGKLGVSDKTQEGIKAALSGASPEQMLALKNSDNEFALQMKALGFKNLTDIETLANEDRASARQREMTVKDNTPRILAGVVTIGFFGILVTLMFYPIPDTSRDITNVMLGVLGSAWSGVVAYYFGSSSSSDKKTALLAKREEEK